MTNETTSTQADHAPSDGRETANLDALIAEVDALPDTERCLLEHNTRVMIEFARRLVVPLREYREVLAHPQTEGGREGWRLVPVEPTEEMQAAGWIDKEDVSPKEIYWAMLAAAPTPTAEPRIESGWDALREAAALLVDEIDGLVSESEGVWGLHLNGDIAPWDELLPGGQYERLTSLDTLRAALATPQAARPGGADAFDGALGLFGHHPDPSTDFCIEVEALQGWKIDMNAGRRSQWPFWGRLSRLLRFVKSDKFEALDEIAQRAKSLVLLLEDKPNPNPDPQTARPVGEDALREAIAALDAAGIQECHVNGDTADVISAPPSSSFQNEHRVIARCSTGPLWVKQAVAIAEALNFVRALAAQPQTATGQGTGNWIAPDEPTLEMERAFDTAYWAKAGDASSPTPTEHPDDGGGAFGYGYRAMRKAALATPSPTPAKTAEGPVPAQEGGR